MQQINLKENNKTKAMIVEKTDQDAPQKNKNAQSQ